MTPLFPPSYNRRVHRVLIVDDEAEIRSALATYYPWTELGFVVAGQAAGSKEARAVIEQEHIDVVLCDIRMPGESGLEFAAWLSKVHPATRIVLLSAYRKFEYAQEAFKYGVRGYLVKPPTEEEFRTVFGVVAKELAQESEERLRSADRAQSAMGGPVSEEDHLRNSVLDDVFAYLRGNCRSACLKTAAKIARMNSTYFSTWFRSKTGRTFHDALTELRMTKAVYLLLEQGKSVVETSEEVGYENPKNFSRAFRRHFGMSPKAYARLTLEHRQKESAG